MQVIGVVLNFIFNTFMRTSCSFGGATSTSSILNGLLASHSTAALHLITCKHSKEKRNGTCFSSHHTDIHSARETPAHICGEKRETTGKKTKQQKRSA